ncbi:uncharacterized protein Cipc [Chironomus tepperi]|uniref:uncharacterized protein Cipc n=1 Tax=Chironomus tepperi TaxID=113505 RepID=UPI00391FC9CA
MSPTICHDNITTLESDEMCENNNTNIKDLNHNVMIKMEEERKEPKDRSMEQLCAKRKLSSDESLLKTKRQRKATDEETVISSLSSSLSLNSDDYGTDTELVAINQNKRKHKYSHRYAPLSKYDNLEEDNLACVISSSDTRCNVQNSLCKRDYTISIDDSNVTSSTTHLDDMVKKITSTMKICKPNTRHLFDVAMSTFKIIKKNQEFQIKLRELQMDTKNFIDSIMENPENQSIKEQLKLLI